MPAGDEKAGGWRRNSARYLFESPWYNVRQDDLTLPNGNQVTYTVVEHPGYVVIVPLLENGDVLMEKIYRHTLNRVCLECPAGGLDGELPAVAANRELREETGYQAGNLQHLGTFAASSGISDAMFHAFLATGLRLNGPPQREETEDIQLHPIPLITLRQMVYTGEVSNGPSALAILLACEQAHSG